MTIKSSLILGCAALVIASTAWVALSGGVSSAASGPNSAGQDGGLLTKGLRGLRSLRMTNLPRVYYIDDDSYWNDGSTGDDWWYGGDDYKGDDWWYNGDDGPNHGGRYRTDDDDYTFVYKPVDSQFIKTTNGGYGGKGGRALADIRFNKVPPVIDGYQTNAWRYSPSRDYVQGVHSSIFPLMPKDFPISGEKATILKRETMADSVIVAGDVQLKGDRNAAYWSDFIGAPSYPGTPEYWDELRAVVEAQVARRRGDLPSTVSHWPATWSEHETLDDIAFAVNQEYPVFHQSKAIETFFKEGIEMHRDMDPFRSVVDFIGMEIRMASINTWAFEAVAPVNFMLKWHYGMPRPEEMAWMIYKGQYTTEADGVPEDLVSLIKSMNLKYATSFTAYVEGSPMHPSFPAMHSAGSTCSYWMPAICKLSPEQYCEALRVDYAVSYARTIAGVHYQMDNMAGLNIGQQIIREKLPAKLADSYGYDAARVRAKLEALTFDWNDFDADACTIGGVSAADHLAKAALV